MSSIAITEVPLAELDRLAKNALEAVLEAYQTETCEDNVPQNLFEAWCEFVLAPRHTDSMIKVPTAFNQKFVATVRSSVQECTTKGYLTKRSAQRMAKVFSALPYAATTPELTCEPVWQQFARVVK